MSREKNQIKIVNLSLFVLSFDYLSRWISLGLFRLVFGDSVAVSHLAVFFFFQLCITIATFSVTFYREFVFISHLKSRSLASLDLSEILEEIVNNFRDNKPYEVIGSSFSILVRIFYTSTFAYMMVNVLVKEIDFVNRGELIGVILASSFFVYGLYVLLLSAFAVPVEKEEIFKRDSYFIQDKKSYLEKFVPRNVNISEEKHYENPIDQNDNDILVIENKIKSLAVRVEAYILESVMFGALGFSGFLTIIAADLDKFNYSNMRMFGHHLVEFMLDLMIFEIKTLEQYRLFSTNPEHLLILIMFETLLCSMFFMLVIAARIKFSRLAENIDNVIGLARSLNNKEEEVYLLRLQNFGNADYLDDRLYMLATKINRMVFQAHKLIEELMPVAAYMSLFRNLGVVMFLLIVLTGLLFFHKTIAVFFTFLALTAYIYKRLDDWYRKKRMSRIIEQQEKEKE